MSKEEIDWFQILPTYVKWPLLIFGGLIGFILLFAIVRAVMVTLF